jgi:hypothetical protein
VRRERRAKTRPLVWSPDGIQPLVGRPIFDRIDELSNDGSSADLHWCGQNPTFIPPGDPFGWHTVSRDDRCVPERAESDTAALLSAASIVEACRTPLDTVMVSTVADRLSSLAWLEDFASMISAIDVESRVGRLRLAELARWLCRFGVDGRHVIGGLSLLAMCGNAGDRALVDRLGRVRPFGPLAIPVLRELLPRPDAAIHALAKGSRGWTRVVAVHLLDKSVDSRTRRWMLDTRYDTLGQLSAVALAAVTGGDLVGALQGECDDRLIDDAGSLLRVLAMNSGPGGIRHYKEGALAIELYLGLMRHAEPSISRLLHCESLYVYLMSRERSRSLESLECRNGLVELLTQIRSRPEWRALLEFTLSFETDREELWQATILADRFGIDPRPAALIWLDRSPRDARPWIVLGSRSTRIEMQDLLRRAEILLQEDLEVGSDHGPWLAIMLKVLQSHPGYGWGIVESALRGSSESLRRTAEGTLSAWPRENWPHGAEELISTAPCPVPRR